MSGGKRAGAGRPKGARNKRSEATIAKAAALGLDPLDVMLENMMFYHRQAVEFGSTDARKLAQECAADAAPYVHARLTASKVTGDAESPFQVLMRTVYENDRN